MKPSPTATTGARVRCATPWTSSQYGKNCYVMKLSNTSYLNVSTEQYAGAILYFYRYKISGNVLGGIGNGGANTFTNTTLLKGCRTD